MQLSFDGELLDALHTLKHLSITVHDDGQMHHYGGLDLIEFEARDEAHSQCAVTMPADKKTELPK
jgi:hypothetical protein